MNYKCLTCGYVFPEERAAHTVEYVRHHWTSDLITEGDSIMICPDCHSDELEQTWDDPTEE